MKRIEGELKTTATSLHTYYESQMEKIFLEKVSAIQKNVAEWEAKFNAEKARDIEQLKVHHQRQVERLVEE